MKLSLIFGAAVLCSGAVAQVSHVLPNDLRAKYRTMMTQWRSGNVIGFFSVYDPAYVSVGPDGKKMNLKEMKMTVKSMVDGSTKRDIKIDFKGVTVKGNRAMIQFVATFDIRDKEGKTLRMQEVGTDTWVKKGKTWWEVKTVDTYFGPAKS